MLLLEAKSSQKELLLQASSPAARHQPSSHTKV